LPDPLPAAGRGLQGLAAGRGLGLAAVAEPEL